MRRRRLTCRDVAELATEYFEGSLPAEQRERFAAHVAGCPGCQTYLRQLRITVDIVHTVADREPVDTSALLSAFREWRGIHNADVDSS
jgi:anti-sigma factor RsiW